MDNTILIWNFTDGPSTHITTSNPTEDKPPQNMTPSADPQEMSASVPQEPARLSEMISKHWRWGYQVNRPGGGSGKKQSWAAYEKPKSGEGDSAVAGGSRGAVAVEAKNLQKPKSSEGGDHGSTVKAVAGEIKSAVAEAATNVAKKPQKAFGRRNRDAKRQLQTTGASQQHGVWDILWRQRSGKEHSTSQHENRAKQAQQLMRSESASEYGTQAPTLAPKVDEADEDAFPPKDEKTCSIS